MVQGRKSHHGFILCLLHTSCFGVSSVKGEKHLSLPEWQGLGSIRIIFSLCFSDIHTNTQPLSHSFVHSSMLSSSRVLCFPAEIRRQIWSQTDCHSSSRHPIVTAPAVVNPVTMAAVRRAEPAAVSAGAGCTDCTL